MTNIILCGGAGTRLWPVSRGSYPKQFCDLGVGDSLFRQTVSRNSTAERFIIVTSAGHYPIAAEQFASVVSKGVQAVFILEPFGRNTAPAVALACMELDRGELVLVTPSDHVVADADNYETLVDAALDAANDNRLVTFGIKPTYPETGYGYIETAPGASGVVRDVASFREKPDRATAERYLASGECYWNSGMFAFKAGAFMGELEAAALDIARASAEARRTAARRRDPVYGYELIEPGEREMAAIRADSVDYAVMEKSRRVSVVLGEIGWNDLGSYDALYDTIVKDSEGNAFSGSTLAIGAKRNLVLAGERKVALVDVENVIVVQTEDATLVAARGRSQSVRAVVEALKSGSEADRALTEKFATARYAWGAETVLDKGDGFEVVRMRIAKGRSTKERSRNGRSETWTVVQGDAVIVFGGGRAMLGPGDRFDVPAGQSHEIENKGDGDLIIIAVIKGSCPARDGIIAV